MPPKAISKEEIDAMIQRAVNAATTAASAQLTADFDAKFNDVTAKFDEMKAEITP
jgi:hypothetical protein